MQTVTFLFLERFLFLEKHASKKVYITPCICKNVVKIGFYYHNVYFYAKNHYLCMWDKNLPAIHK